MRPFDKVLELNLQFGEFIPIVMFTPFVSRTLMYVTTQPLIQSESFHLFIVSSLKSLETSFWLGKSFEYCILYELRYCIRTINFYVKGLHLFLSSFNRRFLVGVQTSNLRPLKNRRSRWASGFWCSSYTRYNLFRLRPPFSLQPSSILFNIT